MERTLPTLQASSEDLTTSARLADRDPSIGLAIGYMIRAFQLTGEGRLDLFKAANRALSHVHID